jgi:hypothetical protein
VLCKEQKVCEGTPCAFEISLDTVASFVLRLVREYQSEKALHLLFGFWRIFGSFEKFDEFADEIESVSGGSFAVRFLHKFCREKDSPAVI